MIEFHLRPWQDSDLPSLLKYADNYNIAKQLTDRFPHPYTEENGRKFIEMASAASPSQILAIEINGEACGAIGLHPQEDIFQKNAELGYWLAEPFWGKGVMTRAIRRMIAYGFQNFDINRIFARPYGSNKASQKVLEKCGFILEGRFEKTLYKNGRYEDELVYAIRRENVMEES